VPYGRVVEVLVEDPALAVDVLELLGDLGLVHLALERPLLGDVERAHELHGQRRAALDGLAGLDVLDRRADDALGVDAVVAPEALVLDRDRRVLERLRDLRVLDRRAQDVGLDEAQARSVRGVDDAGGALVALLEVAVVGGRGREADDVAHGTEHAQQDARHEDAENEEGGAGAVLAPAPPHTCLTRHRVR
jgi:hypothetical protein